MRTPMQWDATKHSGFTSGTPWFSVNPNYTEINVKQALEDENSIFYHYKKLIELRKQHEIIVYGSYDLILEEDEAIFAYTRTLGKEMLLVINNFYEKGAVFTLPEDIQYEAVELLINNYAVDLPYDISAIKLRSYESLVFKLIRA